MFEKTLLVTGGAGFIGTNFIDYFTEHHPNYRLVNLDALTYAARKDVFERQARMPNIVTIHGDIRDAVLVHEILRTYDIQGVLHFAAESHVDNSIPEPLRFIETNIVGTATLLNECLLFWRESGTLETARFHHVSTDEVYGSLGATGYFTETTPYAPSSPYSSSKASSDLLVQAYAKTYGMNVTISNCSNNYGPWQHNEKLIPTVIRKCLAHEPIPVYGTGLNVRDWLWVGDHCRAIDLIFHLGRSGERYNVGGHNEKTNLEIVRAICTLLDENCPWAGRRYEELITFVEDRPGHDFRYAINPEKVMKELGWTPCCGFDLGLRRTVDWYLTAGRSTSTTSPICCR